MAIASLISTALPTHPLNGYLLAGARLTESSHTPYAKSFSTKVTAFHISGLIVEAMVASPITLSVDRIAVVARFNKTHKENQGKKGNHNLHCLHCAQSLLNHTI